MTRKKIKPPVTPRIVPAHPGQQLLRYALLACAFIFSVWISYYYGTTRAPVPETGSAPLAQSPESQQRIRELEQERDTLKQQVAALKQSVQQADRTIRSARARAQQPTPTPTPTPAPAPAPVQAPRPGAPAAGIVDHTLTLENVRIEPTATDRVFRIAFSVRHTDNRSDRVTGTLWIAVNGFSRGVPKRLSFKTLSPDRRLVVKMGFDRQQDVSEEIVLPDDFRPKNILIEAKPYGDKYTGTAQKIDWIAAQ